MLGTLVNVIAVIMGSLVGLLLKGGISKRFEESIMKALGLCIIYIGIEGSLKCTDTLLLIICLVLGSIVGEALNLDHLLNQIGTKIETCLVGNRSDKGSIAKGFVSASLLFCVGSMAIVGALQSGLQQDHHILFVKSMLDGIVSIIYTSTMGIGVIFSSITVLIYQGSITLASSFLGSMLVESQINNIGAIGNILIIGIGLNILEVTHIKLANLLPGVILPIIYYVGYSCFFG